jgi:hypothetical protein
MRIIVISLAILAVLACVSGVALRLGSMGTERVFAVALHLDEGAESGIGSVSARQISERKEPIISIGKPGQAPFIGSSESLKEVIDGRTYLGIELVSVRGELILRVLAGRISAEEYEVRMTTAFAVEVEIEPGHPFEMIDSATGKAISEPRLEPGEKLLLIRAAGRADRAAQRLSPPEIG